MSLEEFITRLEHSRIRTDYLVSLRYRYEFEDHWTHDNAVLLVNENLDYSWLVDWYEGQDYVEVLGCEPIEEIEIAGFRIL